MHDIIKMCSFEGTKSTKGASKLRRDLLNSEISQLRELLPLPASTRQRLSQLQLMALVCVYVRKSNYFQQSMKHLSIPNIESNNMEFLKALSGFLMMLTQGGKLLYISDNAAEYLGHSMEDLLIHGDSVFDIIDKQDHASVQAELVRGVQGSTAPEDDRLFLCRMNVSRNARRQMRFGDQKVVLVQGHYLSYLPLCSRNEPVFIAQCTPVAMPETRENVVQGATNIFTSVHNLDMKFLNIDRNGEFYLGYSSTHLTGVSWYHLLHPDNLKEAQLKHRLITSSEQDKSCVMLIRLQAANGSWQWVHTVLQIKESNTTTTDVQETQTNSQPPQTQQSMIVATNQVIGEKEARVLQANSWLYHYFAMQSRLPNGISYENQIQRINPYYPQVMPFQAQSTPSYVPTLSPATFQPGYQPVSSNPPNYPITSPSYFQSYPHPYSVCFQQSFEHSRDHSWNYYNSLSLSNSSIPPVSQGSSQPQQIDPQPNQNQIRSPKKASPASPRRSTHQAQVTEPISVSARATIATQPKLTPPTAMEETDSLWKYSPQQEVPEYPDLNHFMNPYITASQTKLADLVFDKNASKEIRPFDHHVPAMPGFGRDSWYTQFVR